MPPRGDRERVQQHLEFVEPPRVRVVVRVVRVVRQDALGDAARRRLADGQRRDAVKWGLWIVCLGGQPPSTSRFTLLGTTQIHHQLLQNRNDRLDFFLVW